jgi:AbrB family looped-hinge helix DNA binding protein
MHSTHFPKIVGTATLNDKGQLVIPVEARNELGLTPGSRVVIMSNPERPALTLIKSEVLETMVRDLNEALDSADQSKPNK